MSQFNSIEQQLENMLAAGDFSRLSELSHCGKWEALSDREKDLLGYLLVAQGAMQLSNGDKKAFDSFSLASLVAPHNPQIYYRQAMAFSVYSQSINCLVAACKALQTATQIDPNFYEAWYLWGILLIQRGSFLQEPIFLEESSQKFSEALLHTQDIPKEKKADLFGQWGLCFHVLGKLSGEACDYYRAIEKYRIAAELGLNHAGFWYDYAEVTSGLAGLVGRQDLISEAVRLYQIGIELEPNDFKSWFRLGFCYHRLFESTLDEMYFISAHEAYTHASELDSSEMHVWLNWGILHADAAKEKKDVELFQMSFEKFARADACEPNCPDVLSRWGESQALCGTLTDRVDLMRQAEAKIIRSLELEPENADTWYVYGACLSELGRYFSDAQYYLQAIEKIQYGLSLNSQNPILWHTLSLAHFAIGELNNDVEMIRKALEYFTKVIECTQGRVPAEFWNDWGVAHMKLAELINDQSCVESAIEKFERALGMTGNGSKQYIPSSVDPSWVYNYACALDFLGSFTEDIGKHDKAIQLLTHLINEVPMTPHLRYNLAMALSNYAELTDDIEAYQRALDNFQFFLSHENEDGAAWNDWGLTLINFAELIHESTHPEKSRLLYEQAENKFLHAIALGVTEAFYNLACLYSLLENYPAAMHYIEKAEMAGALPPIDDILHDAWLDGLRQTPHFRHFLARKNSDE